MKADRRGMTFDIWFAIGQICVLIGGSSLLVAAVAWALGRWA